MIKNTSSRHEEPTRLFLRIQFKTALVVMGMRTLQGDQMKGGNPIKGR